MIITYSAIIFWTSFLLSARKTGLVNHINKIKRMLWSAAIRLSNILSTDTAVHLAGYFACYMCAWSLTAPPALL